MHTFAVQKIETINGKQEFNMLIVDGKSLLEEFEESLEDIYENEMNSIYLYMEEVANCTSLPKSKFREINCGKGNIKEYEFKSKHLRVYAIKQFGGKLVVMCGYKNSQKKDISKFRELKKEYLKISKKN